MGESASLGGVAQLQAVTIKPEIPVGAKVPPVVSAQDANTPTPLTTNCAPPTAVAPQPPPPPLSSMPPATAPVPPPAAAPAALHPSAPLDPAAHAVGRTDSPAVATSANAAVAPSPGQYHHSYQPLYAPYAPAYPNSVPYPSSQTSSAPGTLPTQQPPPIITQPQSITPTHQMAIPPISSQQTLPPSSVPSTISHHPVAESPKRPPSAPKVAVSPRGEPVRERESYSVTSLSRSSVRTSTPVQTHSGVAQPATVSVSSSLGAPPIAAPLPLAKPWATPASAPQPTLTSRLSPAQPRPAPSLHPGAYQPAGAPPLFAPPPLAPPAVSRASPMATAAATVTNPNPFSAESLFQKKHSFTDQADVLRRELDNRFLASQDRALGPTYLRAEMHQHQHHHTHVHQHTTSLLPPPGASALFSTQLPLTPMDPLARRTQSSFKDIPKLGGVDSPFYRQGLGVPGYPSYTSGLIGHPGLTTGPTPFVPPNHLPTFQPKSLTPQDPTKPRIMKNGKWNAMHVRVAWEIYHHQQKSGDAKLPLPTMGSKPGVPSASDLLRSPSHLFSPGMHSRPPEMPPYPPSLASAHRPVGFDQPPHHASSMFSAHPSYLGKSPFSAASSMLPFAKYGGSPLGASTTSPFSMSPFASREAHLGLGPLHHDPWRTMPRSIPGLPPSVNPLPPTLPGLPPPAPWPIKPDPVLEQREREAREREERERERLRREREERERREREEKQRRLEQQQQQERERERREKERREMERRENERREREREMMLHQQRMAAESAAKQSMQPPVLRDRSPLRNGQPEMNDIRVKEEPRTKEEELLTRTDPSFNLRYHPYLRHPPGSLQPPPPSALDRSRMLAHTLPPHYPPPGAHWPPTTMASDLYRYGYNPLMESMRPLDERAYYGAYGPAAHHAAQLRPKDPSLLHLRGGPGPPPPVHKLSGTPPIDHHKKEEPR